MLDAAQALSSGATTAGLPAGLQAARRDPGMPEAPREGLAAHHALYVLAIEQMPQGLSMFDADDRLLVANRRYRDLWHLPDALCQPGARFGDLMAANPATELPCHDPYLAEATEAGQPSRRRREWQLRDGRIIGVTITRLPGGACVALHEDITEQRRNQQQVAYLARHDALTGLPNRAQLSDELTRQLPRVHRGEELALLYLDLDRFKSVNDTLGHAAGDLLLRRVAERLRAGAREGDLIARLGGDEFAILQTGTTQPAGSTALAKRLIEALSQPFDLDGHQVHIGTSVGVAVAPFDGDHAEALIKSADLALYRAKAAGRGVLRYFEPEMDARMQLRRQLENDLRGAIARGEFELAFQAQVAADSHAVVGVEALIRWNHPVRGRVSPADFIPLAEETGLIIPIGVWVLRQACLAAMAWPAPVRIAVNLSPVQFKSRTLLRDVLDALHDSGLPPQRLELEITEAVLLDDTEQALSVLHAMRERGIRISMDDFGTGYSSLSYLRRFPFDKIKIDRSFIQDAALGGDALAIVGAISSLGRSLGMSTTAEGVETDEQLAAVCAAGCVEVQGYLFSRPGPAGDIAALIAGRTPPGLPVAAPAAAAPSEPGASCSNDSST
ncbi:MAG: EAL domain-containing protein [Aquabacterium sp.]|nr:EAL domain-containing protein [Aquabacterium sp.]